MKISTSIMIIMLMSTLLSYGPVFADTVAHSAVGNNPDNPPEDWQMRNANLEAQQADTAKKNADTAAQNANTATKILTPVPAPKEETPAPQGSINCFIVKAGWFNGIWVPDHRVCKYNPSKEGVVWIQGYWACTKYKTTTKMEGECNNWIWKPGRWVGTFEVY